MVLDLTEIVEEPGQRWQIPVGFPPAPTPGLQFQGAATGDVVIYNTGSDLVFAGSVAASLQTSCFRCLEPFPLEVQGEVEAIAPLDMLVTPPTGKPVEIDPDLAAIFSADGADLAELVRQSLLLALPLRMICGEDCQGLCSQCGKNLNAGACQCRAEDVDPRLAGLAAWRPK